MIIKPTIGKILWYWPSQQDVDLKGFNIIDRMQPLAAMVTYVIHVRMVNLTVFDHKGVSWPRVSILIKQGDDPRPGFGLSSYAEWPKVVKEPKPK